MAETNELVKITLNIYKKDKETLEQFFPGLGYSVALRKLTHRHCNVIRERAAQADIGVQHDDIGNINIEFSALVGEQS